MPGFFLHQGATVTCMHAGQAQPPPPAPRVLVNGQPIVTQAVPYVVAGCPFVIGVAPSPCVSAQWVMGAIRVMSGGVPVLLKDSQSVCVPNGTPLTIGITQFRVKGS